MFCFKCGSRQADTAKFCGVCGTNLAGVATPPEPVAPTPPLVVPSAPSSAAPPRSQVVAATPSASLTVEQWEVTAHPPDSDGDSRFEAKAVVVYEGAAPASLARLRWIAYDSTGRLPLVQAESDVTRDIDDGDDVELEASSYGKLGTDVTADACRVEAQVLVFPGDRETILSAPLPEAGVVGGRPDGARVGAATLVAWKVASAESSEDSSSYSVTLVIRNDGTALLAAVTVRLRVMSRKGDVWTTEYLQSAQLVPGEQRVLESTFWVSERTRARKGATLEVVATACSDPLLCSLGTTTPTVAAAVENEEEEGEEPPAENDSAEGAGSSARRVLFMNGPLVMRRHKYSSRSLFVCIFAAEGVDYDREAIGEATWPGGAWGCIDPPGPASGFDAIKLDELAQGRVPLSKVKASIGIPSYASSASGYMDGYFFADEPDGTLREVGGEEFAAAIQGGRPTDTVEIVEYEPD